MPTDLGREFEITWRGTPEQMLPADVPLWHEYLDKNAWRFKLFYYNVRIGGPDVTKLLADEPMKRMWYAATAKRIDVLAELENEIWIVEVASSPYLRAVGQCLTYQFLWNEDPKINKPVSTKLLTTFLDEDLTRVLRHYGVEIIHP